MSSPRFEGKVALVTGAGSGIGRAVSVRLAAEGASVLAVDVNADGLDATKDLASSQVVTHHADLSDPDACFATVAQCVELFGRLDVLGNVAGIYLAAHTVTTTR